MKFTNDKRKDGTPREYGLQFNPNGTVELMELTPAGKWTFRKAYAANNTLSFRLIAKECAGEQPVASLDEFLERIEVAAEKVTKALHEEELI